MTPHRPEMGEVARSAARVLNLEIPAGKATRQFIQKTCERLAYQPTREARQRLLGERNGFDKLVELVDIAHTTPT